MNQTEFYMALETHAWDPLVSLFFESMTCVTSSSHIRHIANQKQKQKTLSKVPEKENHSSSELEIPTARLWYVIINEQCEKQEKISSQGDFLQRKYKLEKWIILVVNHSNRHNTICTDEKPAGDSEQEGSCLYFLYNECKIVQHLNESWSLSNVKIPSLLVPVKKNSFYSLGSFSSCS